MKCLGIFVIMLAALNAPAALTGSFGPDVPNMSETITLDKYSGANALGSVKFTVMLIINDGQFEFDNDADTPTGVTIDLDVEAALSSSDVTLPANPSTTVTYDNTINLGANDGDSKRGLNTGGMDYASINTGIRSITESCYVPAEALSNYMGSGTFDVTVEVSHQLSLSMDGGVAVETIPTLCEGTVTVEYSGVTYSSFQRSVNWEGNDSSMLADADGDSLNNLLEYAFVSNPTNAAEANMPTGGIEAIDGMTWLTLTYLENLDATDLTYTIEHTTSLTNGFSPVLPPFLNRIITPINDAMQQVQVRYETTNENGFLRVKVRAD